MPALDDEWVNSVMFGNGEYGGSRFNWICWLSPAGSWACSRGVWHCRIQERLVHLLGTTFDIQGLLRPENLQIFLLLRFQMRWFTRQISSETAIVMLQLRPRWACTTRLAGIQQGALLKERLAKCCSPFHRWLRSGWQLRSAWATARTLLAYRVPLASWWHQACPLIV